MSTLWRWQAIGSFEFLKGVGARMEAVDEPRWLSWSVFEDDEANKEGRLDVLFDHMPDEDAFKAEIALSEAEAEPLTITLSPLPEEDWIRMSLEGLPPVVAGRFVLYGAHDRDNLPEGKLPIEIEAGPAFGTGHHGTTKGCLIAADQLAERGVSPTSILDLGCGTGALSIAAALLWTEAETIWATDIDDVAIVETEANAQKNSVADRITAFEADGFSHDKFQGVQFDLIFANILAGPLEVLAQQLSDKLATGGTAILSGLLEHQIDTVEAAYKKAGLSVRDQNLIEGWAILTLDRG